MLNKIHEGNTLNILKTMPNNMVDMSVTSPPYNKKITNSGKNSIMKPITYDSIGDNMLESDYQQDQINVLNEIYRVTKPGGSMFYNHKVRHLKGIMTHPMEWLTKTDWHLRQEIIWNRKVAIEVGGYRFYQVDERIYWLYKPYKNNLIGAKMISKHARVSSVWEFAPDRKNPHPAPFPIELPIRCILAMLDTNNGIVLDPYMGCFDKETEVLTKRGWLLFENLLKDDIICSLNPETNIIEWVSFTKFIKYKFNGEMYNIKGKMIDLLVTPNHKIYSKEYHHKKFELYTMDNFKYKTFHKCNKGIYADGIDFKNKSWLEFLGFWIGDGYKIKRSKSNRGWIIGFNLQKERKIKYLINLLNKLAIKFKIYSRKNDMTSFRISNKSLWLELDGNSHTKRVPSYIFELNSTNIKSFIDGYHHADGHKNQLYSVNKKLLDDFQILIFLTGKSSNIFNKKSRVSYIDGRKINQKDQYILSTHNIRNYIKLHQENISRIEYDDYVYDVTLKKNHILYIRRNGKCCWSGNSGTTAVACKLLDKDFIGIDISKNYINNAYKRINNFESERYKLDKELEFHVVKKSYKQRQKEKQI